MKTKISILVGMVFLLTSFRVMPTRTIMGKVTSKEDGSVLSGVNVVLKGTTTGTVTDGQGNYLITAPDQGGVLVFSFIGLQTKEVKIENKNRIDVSLEVDVRQLSETVVTGKPGKIEKKKLSDSDAAIGVPLQGRVAVYKLEGQRPNQRTWLINLHQLKYMKRRSNSIQKSMTELRKIFFTMQFIVHFPLFPLTLMLLRTAISAGLSREGNAPHKMPCA